jgi:hypothetical protein
MHSLVELVELVEGEGGHAVGGGGLLSHEHEERGASHFITVSRGAKKQKKRLIAEEEGKVLYADIWRCRRGGQGPGDPYEDKRVGREHQATRCYMRLGA